MDDPTGPDAWKVGSLTHERPVAYGAEREAHPLERAKQRADAPRRTRAPEKASLA